nr:GCN5-related N-acetyltransferase [uncultured bacterium]
MFSRLDSPRMILRRFAEADLETFLAYRNDPEVARYQAWESCVEEEARALFREQERLEPGEPGHWFQFAMQSRETGELVGNCALKVGEPDARQGMIGCTLARGRQGRGLAAEALACVLDYAFGPLNLHRVVALTDCRNRAGARLVEGLGLRREGHFIRNVWFKGEWADEYLYAILGDEWRRRPAGGRASPTPDS